MMDYYIFFYSCGVKSTLKRLYPLLEGGCQFVVLIFSLKVFLCSVESDQIRRLQGLRVHVI